MGVLIPRIHKSGEVRNIWDAGALRQGLRTGPEATLLTTEQPVVMADDGSGRPTRVHPPAVHAKLIINKRPAVGIPYKEQNEGRMNWRGLT